MENCDSEQDESSDYLEEIMTDEREDTDQCDKNREGVQSGPAQGWRGGAVRMWWSLAR